MNAIEAMERDIRNSLPTAWTRLRRPRKAQGEWWLDAKQDAHVVTIQWSPRRGFGISASAFGNGYGEGPEETFEEGREATACVLELLKNKKHTVPPKHVLLQELRGLVGFTQEELAEKLGVQQAAVSRFERREDITLSALRRYVSAMGGDLEISVRTASGDSLKLVDPGENHAGHLQSARDRKRLPKMALVVIHTSDLERARSFYSTLGLAFNLEKHGQGPAHYSCSMDGTVVELYPTKRKVTGGAKLGLRIFAPKAALERLLSAGHLREAPKSVKRDVSPEVWVIRDPDGNDLELSAI